VRIIGFHALKVGPLVANSGRVQQDWENIVKSLLFFTAAALLLVESAVAYATPGDSAADRPECKWCGSERSNWGIPLQPQVVARPVCHNVKQRVETQKGHFVSRIHRVCA
jgi:hypothetical protein